MARTYLERNLEHFDACGRDELVKHALRALRESMPQDKELSVENTSLGVGGKGEKFELIEGEKARSWLESALEKQEGQAGADGGEGGESMDVDKPST